jgi:hypothetical protein
MWRRVRDGLTAVLLGGSLGGFVLLEPPIAQNQGGKWSADTARPIHQWSFVSAFDVGAKCDEKRSARLANAAGDLGVDAESDQPGTKLGAIFDARRQSRCVPDTQYFPEGAPGKKAAGQ